MLSPLLVPNHAWHSGAQHVYFLEVQQAKADKFAACSVMLGSNLTCMLSCQYGSVLISNAARRHFSISCQQSSTGPLVVWLTKLIS